MSMNPDPAPSQELPGRGIFTTADPATLVVGLNTRTEARLTPHFVADIRDRGVRQPITVRRRGSDGALVVREGKRRTLAAVRAGLAEVEIIIRPGDADAPDRDPDAEIERIIDQLAENGHRAPISDTDEVRSAQQLIDLGLSAAQIARRTHFPAPRVRSTTAVARSPQATAALEHTGQLTLGEAVIMAEFDDDPAAVESLTAASQRPGAFVHAAQRLRDDRQRTRLRDQAHQQLTDQGIPVLDDDTDRRWERISELRWDPDTPSGTAIDPDRHRTCPGHAAVIQIDRHWRDGITAYARWVCADAAAHGHAPLTDRTVLRADLGRQGGAMTEEQKAERRRVIANNKAWDSAQTVRRDWLTDFLSATKPPADAAVFVATSLGDAHHCLGRALTDRHALACQLLGLDPPTGTRPGGTPHPIARAATTASGPRAVMLSLAVVLAAFESATSRYTWRTPDPSNQAYFRRLADWGYHLSEVEQLVLQPGTDSPGDDAANAAPPDDDAAAPQTTSVTAA